MNRCGKMIGLILLSAVVVLSACAGTGARTQDLLQRDYRGMNDEELLTYYYQVNDQIAREERGATGSSVGVGVGGGPFRVGVGTGLTRVPIAEELRERRNEVRAELHRRGLSP